MRRVNALQLGSSDMTMVEDAAMYWLGEHRHTPPDHAGDIPFMTRRCLEAGIVVSYCRPFATSEGLVSLTRAPGLSDELRDAHKSFMGQRDEVYAHTDATEHRGVEADDWITTDRLISAVETWSPPSRKGMSLLRDLARIHRAKWDAEADEVADLIATLDAAEGSPPAEPQSDAT